MKIFLTLFLAVFFILVLAAIWIPKNVSNPVKYLTAKPKFGIKVKYWYTNDDDKHRYLVVFTNNDWASETEVFELWDNTKYVGYVSVSSSTYAGSKEEAEKFAQQFDSYEKCLEHNSKIIEAEKELTAFYLEKGYPLERPEKKLSTPEIKEIIIK